MGDDDPGFRQAATVVGALSAAFAVAGVIVAPARPVFAVLLLLALIVLVATWARRRQVDLARGRQVPHFPVAWTAIMAIFTVVLWAFVIVPRLFTTGLPAANPGHQAATSTPTSAPAPSATAPTPTAPLSPAPTPTSPPRYRADWSKDLAGWAISPHWTLVDGTLTNDGTESVDQMTATAPVDLSSTRDYAVEADIMLVRYGDAGAFTGADSFGLVVRSPQPKSGYHAGHCVQSGLLACDPGGPKYSAVIWDAGKNGVLQSAEFQPPQSGWHHYRLEVKGTAVTFTVPDLGVNISTTDTTYLAPGKVGLFSNDCQISVKNFTVTAA